MLDLFAKFLEERDNLPEEMFGLAEASLKPVGEDLSLGDIKNERDIQMDYVLHYKIQKDINELMEEHSREHNIFPNKHHNCDEFQDCISVLERKARYIIDTFWLSVRSKYDISPKKMLGLREGWQVIEIKEKKCAYAGQEKN